MGTLIINDRYEVLAELGRGGMGVVYRANQRSLDRVVAIKMLSRDLATDNEFRRRFQQEAQAIARLQHENIITVYDIEADRGTFFIIMEYVEGQSLQNLLKSGGRMEPERAARLMAQVARALGYAHRKGVIHRDIKPDNIMVVGEGENEKAMVMDFGIARVADSTLKTQTGVSMGTPKYMSPEQARGQHVDNRSDLYSLGVVLYACLTGSLPFDGDSPFTVALKHMQEDVPPPTDRVPDLPKPLESVVLRAMTKARDERFQTGEEFSAALNAAVAAPLEPERDVEDEVIGAFGGGAAIEDENASELPSVDSVESSAYATSAPSASRPAKRRSAVPIALAAALLLIVVIAGAMIARSRSGGDSPAVASAETPEATLTPTPPSATPAPQRTRAPRPTVSPAPSPAISPNAGNDDGGRPNALFKRDAIGRILRNTGRPQFGLGNVNPDIRKSIHMMQELEGQFKRMTDRGPLNADNIERLAGDMADMMKEAEQADDVDEDDWRAFYLAFYQMSTRMKTQSETDMRALLKKFQQDWPEYSDVLKNIMEVYISIADKAGVDREAIFNRERPALRDRTANRPRRPRPSPRS